MYHPYSVSPLGIADAASELCDLVWIYDHRDPLLAPMAPLLRRLGPNVDTAGLDEAHIVERVAAHGPDGIVTFADQMELTAAIADSLGLRFHTRQTAGRLANKYQQRIALAAAGVPVPRFWPISATMSGPELALLADQIVYPVVLKPQDGLGSRETYLLEDAPSLLHLLAGTAIEAGGLLAEEVLTEAHPRPEQHFADVLMVETVVQDGSFTHLTATGHFIPAPPFRGTGSFVPSHLDPGTVREVYAATEAAARALGITEGFINTDLILTPDGPRVLEVNGRVGGQIPELCQLAGHVQPILPLAMALAVRSEQLNVHPLAADCVAFCMTYQAPMEAQRLVLLRGLDRIGQLPGVTHVVPNKQVGDALDWREGTIGKLFTVYGTTPDHQALDELQHAVHAALDVAYD